EKRGKVSADETEACQRGSMQQRGGERCECHDPEQDESHARSQEVIERVGGIDIGIGDGGAGGREGTRDMRRRQPRYPNQSVAAVATQAARQGKALQGPPRASAALALLPAAALRTRRSVRQAELARPAAPGPPAASLPLGGLRARQAVRRGGANPRRARSISP